MNTLVGFQTKRKDLWEGFENVNIDSFESHVCKTNHHSYVPNIHCEFELLKTSKRKSDLKTKKTLIHIYEEGHNVSVYLKENEIL